MRLTQRKYRCDDDYWAIRQFLREVFLLNGRREFSWPLSRWDYWRWHVNANIFRFSLESRGVFVGDRRGPAGRGAASRRAGRGVPGGPSRLPLGRAGGGDAVSGGDAVRHDAG